MGINGFVDRQNRAGRPYAFLVLALLQVPGPLAIFHMPIDIAVSLIAHYLVTTAECIGASFASSLFCARNGTLCLFIAVCRSSTSA